MPGGSRTKTVFHVKVVKQSKYGWHETPKSRTHVKVQLRADKRDAGQHRELGLLRRTSHFDVAKTALEVETLHIPTEEPRRKSAKSRAGRSPPTRRKQSKEKPLNENDVKKTSEVVYTYKDVEYHGTLKGISRRGARLFSVLLNTKDAEELKRVLLNTEDAKKLKGKSKAPNVLARTIRVPLSTLKRKPQDPATHARAAKKRKSHFFRRGDNATYTHDLNGKEYDVTVCTQLLSTPGIAGPGQVEVKLRPGKSRDAFRELLNLGLGRPESRFRVAKTTLKPEAPS